MWYVLIYHHHGYNHHVCPCVPAFVVNVVVLYVTTIVSFQVSDSAISFSNLKPMDFIHLDYFIYRIRSDKTNR